MKSKTNRGVRRGGAPLWRKWADENGLVYNEKTGEVRKWAKKRAYGWPIISPKRLWTSTSPSGNDKLCARVRANVLKLMAKVEK